MMQDERDFIDDLMEAVDPQRIVDTAKHLLEEEALARKAFREWVKPDVKAEFINGRVIVHSPAKRRHNQATGFVSHLLMSFVLSRDLGEVAVEKALVGLKRNDVEPDVCYWPKEISDLFTDDMNVYPPPSLVVEVLSKSTQLRDRGVKKDAYESDGVTEYWVVDPVAETLHQYVLEKSVAGELVYSLRKHYVENDDVESIVLEGFSVPLRALFDGRQCNREAVRLSATEGPEV